MASAASPANVDIQKEIHRNTTSNNSTGGITKPNQHVKQFQNKISIQITDECTGHIRNDLIL